ncbi:MAG TPA: PKD domain-containing protein, partial [Nitrospiraceae bacterium]|nr:PKD domain-containing protein [Nitrospiraceae bacterium]
ANPDLNARRIVGYGLRNPFRFTIRPGSNEVWAGDVGWSTWEEINRIVDPKNPTVTNFGWPCYEGSGRQSGYDGANLNICENLYAQTGAVTAPYYTYDHSQMVVAGETCPTGSSSIAGLAFYNGGNYPANYSGALFFTDYSRDCIWVMFRGANGLPDPANRATFLAGAVNPVDLQIGPGGDLFYVDLHPGVTGGGTVRRLSYTSSSNNPPAAVMTATPLFGAVPLTVNFNASGSSDPDTGDTLSYSWDLNGDGIFNDATTTTATFTYTTAGNYTAKLRVTDSRGTSTETTKLIAAGNTPPTAIIDTPVTGTRWQVGQTVTFSGHATDLEQGTLSAASLSWAVNLLHCPSTCHTHPVQTFPGVATGSFPAPDHEFPTQIEIVLTVTDAGGLQDKKSIILDPSTVNLTFQTSPTGLQLVVGSTSLTTPLARTVIIGSSNSVSATTPQTLGGTTYSFSTWSDGGAQTHNIVAGGSPATYTATYAAAGDTTPPSTVTGLTATAVSATRINLSWDAATDNVGVTGYRVERCQGAGCTNFVQIASPTGRTFSNRFLIPSTTYRYRVRAADAAGNLGPYSAISTATTN